MTSIKDAHKSTPTAVTMMVFTVAWFIKILKIIAVPRLRDKEEEVKDNLTTFLDCVNAINSLSCDVTKLGVYDLSDFRVMRAFGFLIYPRQLKLVDSFNFKDRMKHPDVPYNGITPEIFEAVQIMLADSMRIRDKEFVPVTDFRKCLVISDEIAQNLLSDGIGANYVDTKQFPLVVDANLINDNMRYHAFNISYDEMCEAVAIRNMRDLFGVTGG
jgi:hypothetical protein